MVKRVARIALAPSAARTARSSWVSVPKVTVGTRVEMTFRRLFVADGFANYFWKARPVRDDAPRLARGNSQ